MPLFTISAPRGRLTSMAMRWFRVGHVSCSKSQHRNCLCTHICSSDIRSATEAGSERHQSSKDHERFANSRACKKINGQAQARSFQGAPAQGILQRHHRVAPLQASTDGTKQGVHGHQHRAKVELQVFVLTPKTRPRTCVQDLETSAALFR